jgi:hypothetical protein
VIFRLYNAKTRSAGKRSLSLGSAVAIARARGCSFKWPSLLSMLLRDGIIWAVKQSLSLSPITSRHELGPKATLAAQGTLRFQVANFPREPALKPISGFQYHNLLGFHKRCGTTVPILATLSYVRQWISEQTLRLFTENHNECSASSGQTSELFPNFEKWVISLYSTPSLASVVRSLYATHRYRPRNTTSQLDGQRSSGLEWGPCIPL